MKRIVPETLFDFISVGNPRFSPNGKMLAFNVAKADKEKNGYVSDIWLMDDKNSRPLTVGGDGSQIIWTPQNTILFQTVRCPRVKAALKNHEEISSFYEIDPASGEARPAFTLPFKASGLSYLKDELYVFSARRDLVTRGLSGDELKKVRAERANPAYDQFTELPFWLNGRGIIDRLRDVVYIYDRAKNTCTRISDEEWNCSFQCLFEDKIIYTGGPVGDDRTSRTGIYSYDLATGETCEIAPWGAYTVSAVRAFGKRLLIVAAKGSTQYRGDGQRFYIWDPLKGSIELFSDYAYIKFSGGCATDINLSMGIHEKLTEKGMYFLTYVVDQSCIKLLDFDGRIWDVEAPQKGTFSGFDICGDRLVTAMFTDKAPAELFENGEKLTHFNDEIIKDMDIRVPEFMSFTASDGYEIHGWVISPPGYTPGKKFPGILYMHGGPRGALSQVLDHQVQTLVGAGYFVFFCNPRGSDGRGDDYANIRHQYGDVDYKNLMDFTDEVLRRYPDIDPDRVAVTGGSYGGFMTNWIIGHTDRFKCAVSQRSVANWITFEHTAGLGPGYTLLCHEDSTQHDAAYLWDISPLKYADNVVTPTLFIHADQDYACWMGEAVQMFTALQMRNVPSKVCMFHNEHHNLGRNGTPSKRVSRLNEMIAWFDKYTK